MANTGNTQQIIDYGASANDGTGDPLREAFIKTDENFSNIWLAGPVGSNITISNNTVQVNNTNGNLVLRPNGIGIIQGNAHVVPNTDDLRNLGSANLRWRTAYIGSGGLDVSGTLNATNAVMSGDVTVQGNLTVEGDTIQIGNITTDTLTIQLANSATNTAAANGAGITVGANDDIATILYNDSANVWNVNIGLSAAGNISAPYFFGNGAFLTGISSYSNANVANYLPIYSGNLTANNAVLSQGLIVNNSGNIWNFNAASDTLGFPSGASWYSNPATGDDFINSAQDGYLTFTTYDASLNEAVLLKLYHGIAQLSIENGVNYDWTFDNSGVFSTPGTIKPSANGIGDLGSSAQQWSNLWVANTATFDGNVSISESGNRWFFDGSTDTLSFPTGASWASDPTLSEDFINSATNGYITLTTYDAAVNEATRLKLYHALAEITITNGTTHTWQFLDGGNMTVPGAILPSANAVYSLGSSTNQWANLWIANNTIYLGGVPLGITSSNVLTVNGEPILSNDSDTSITTTGNITANYFIGDGSQLTGIETNRIFNGTSNVNIAQADGDATITANGSPTWTFGTDGNLTYPDGTICVGGATYAAPGASVNMISNNAYNQVRVDDANVEIYTSTNGIVVKQWLFDGTGVLSLPGNIDAGSHYINNLSDPFNAQDAATKNYVDLVAQGLHVHPSCNVATTEDLATYTGATVTYDNGTGGVGATLTFSGNTLVDIDGISLSAQDRILVKDEANAAFNGIYVYSNNTALTRATDFDSDVEGLGGDFVFVTSGLTNADTGWVQITDAPSIGNSNIVWEQFSAAGAYSANTAAGLVLNGSQFNAKVDGITTAFDGSGNIVVKAGANLTTPNIDSATGTSLSLTGNISAGNFVGSGTNVDIVAGSYDWSFDNTGNLTLPGNTFAVNYANGLAVNLSTYGNANVVANLASLGSNPISTTGNVTADYLIGNGSQLTAVNATTVDITNTNGLTTVYYPTFVENRSSAQIVRADVDLSYRTDNNTLTTGNLTSGGNITGGNLLTGGQVSATGNITGNYILGNGSLLTGVAASYGDPNVATFLASYGSNTISTSGNITAGAVFATNNGNGTNFKIGDDLWLGDVNVSDTVSLRGVQNAANAFILFGNADTTSTLGRSGTGPLTWKGAFSVTGNITPGNILTDGYYYANGTPVSFGGGGNSFSTVSANGTSVVADSTSDTITYTPGNNLVITGNATSDTVTFAVSDAPTFTGNVTAQNFIGNISVTGNVTGTSSNVGIVAGAYQWTFDNTGNLVLSGNTFAVNYANGTAVSLAGTYGNANVVANLAALGPNPVSTTGNVAGGILISSGTIFGNPDLILGNTANASATRTRIVTDTTFSYIQTGNGTVGSTGNIVFSPYSSSTQKVVIDTGSGNLNVTGNIIVAGNATTGISAIIAGVTNTILPNTIASFSANVNNYTQITLENTNGGADATADFILTADNGTDTVNYGDFGIINSGYDVNTPTNSLGNIVYAADTYVYAQGNTSNTAQSGGNLVLGTTTATKNIKLFAGGNTSSALIATVSNVGITMNSGNITGNTNGFAIGYRDIPQVTFSANATISTADAGKHYYSTSASNLVMTIANNASQAFAIGSAINIINLGTGTITIAQGAGVTLYYAGNSTSGNRSLASYGAGTIQKVATDTWFLVGVGIT